MDPEGERWLAALGLAGTPVTEAIPDLVLVVTDRWGQQRRALACQRLPAVRESPLPGLYVCSDPGSGARVLLGGAFGASQAVEAVHVGGALGTPAAILVGGCAALQPGIDVGDVVVPQSATIGEGVSQYYGGHGTADADPDLLERAVTAVAAAGRTARRGRVVTSAASLTHSDRLVESWAGGGHLALDLETSAMYAVATYFGMRAVALLSVDAAPLAAGGDWLDLPRPRRALSAAALGTLVDIAIAVGSGADRDAAPP